MVNAMNTNTAESRVMAGAATGTQHSSRRVIRILLPRMGANSFPATMVGSWGARRCERPALGQRRARGSVAGALAYSARHVSTAAAGAATQCTGGVGGWPGGAVRTGL